MTSKKIYIGTSVASSIIMLTLMAPAFNAGMHYLPQFWRAVAVVLWFAMLCWYPIGLWLWVRKK